MYLIKEEGKQM